MRKCRVTSNSRGVSSEGSFSELRRLALSTYYRPYVCQVDKSTSCSRCKCTPFNKQEWCTNAGIHKDTTRWAPLEDRLSNKGYIWHKGAMFWREVHAGDKCSRSKVQLLSRAQYFFSSSIFLYFLVADLYVGSHLEEKQISHIFFFKWWWVPWN